MKKLVMGLVTVLGTAVVASIMVTGATSQPLYEERGIACGVFDGNGNGAVTFDSRLVQQANGRVQLDCYYSGPNDDGKREVLNYNKTGASCGLAQFGSTLNWKNQISADGSVRLVCATMLEPDAAPAVSGGSTGVG